jgi:alginate O-acetyltransferase complex protein AlgJ
MNGSVSRLFDRLTIAFFAIVLALPLLGLFPKWDLHSGEEDEKRAPAPFPAWSWKPSGMAEFPKQFDAWFRDHFGFRRLLIRGHSALLYYGLRTSPTPKVIIGKHGWLYYDGIHARDGDPITEYRGMLVETPYQLERWRWMFQDINDWLHEQNIRFLLVLVPAKELVYPEYMPDYLAPVGPSANAQVSSYLQKYGAFEMLDLTPVLQEARKEERLYMKTDTHWNAYGAYVGYREIMQRLTAWYANLQPWPLTDFNVRKAPYFAGDLGQMMDLRRVMSEEMVVVEPTRPRRADPRKIGDEALPNVISEIDDPALPRAVVFRDSFTEDLLPYIAEHFRRALYIWGRQGVELAPIVEEKPDLVLHVLADRILGRGFRYPTPMQQRANEKRFQRSTNLLFTIDATTGFGGIRPARSCSIEAYGTDLLVIATNSDAQVELPAVPGIDTTLPIARIDVTSSGRTDVTIEWDSPSAGQANELRCAVSGPVQKGTNILHLPLMDPETTGPLRLQFSHKGKYLLHRVEVRAIPRY